MACASRLLAPEPPEDKSKDGGASVEYTNQKDRKKFSQMKSADEAFEAMGAGPSIK